MITSYSSPQSLFSAEALEELRSYVEGSREVLYLKATLSENLIESLKFLGNSIETSDNIDKADVLIITSPSGKMKLDSLQLEILQYLEKHSTGLLIIDHELNYVNILKPFKKLTSNTANSMDENELLSYISLGGLVSSHKEDFEERSSQKEMLKGTLNAFNNNSFYVCEAPTGTGKSIAYLLAAITYAHKNQVKVVVSTNTIALQEQLFYKDLPFMKSILPFSFTYALVKGKNNFLCKQRFELFQFTNALSEHASDIEYLNKWIAGSNTGDKSELSFDINSTLWDEVNVDGQLCRPNHCPFKEECGYLKQRDKNFASDILIVNHHILCADIQVKDQMEGDNVQGVLPPYETVVIDEAHNLEEVATNYFTQSFSNSSIQRTFNKIIRFDSKKITGGILKEILDVQSSSSLEEQLGTLIDVIRDFNQLTPLYQSVDTFLAQQLQQNSKEKNIRIKKEYFNDPLWKSDCLSSIEKLQSQLQKISIRLQKILEYLEGERVNEKLDSSLHTFKIFSSRIGEALNVLEAFFNEELESTYVKSIRTHLFNNQFFFSVQITSLDVSELLYDKFFSKLKRSVLTSATLCDDKGFDFFNHSIGLHHLETLKSQKLPSNFDYVKNVDFLLPKDVSLPTAHTFIQDICRYTASLAILSEGKTLVLFTSFQQLNATYDFLFKTLKAQGITVLKQGELPKHKLIEAFKGGSSVLLGVNSFWEGVDLKGDVLKNLIITKLPFHVPNDPFYEAKTENMEKNGQNSFMEYSVPLAIVKLKQGFGRLIRSSTDTGVFCILDNRVTTKPYGRLFLKALPPMKQIHSIDDIQHL